MTVILATEEAEIRRMVVQSQPRQVVLEILLLIVLEDQQIICPV
jgi:hypothetical protein